MAIIPFVSRHKPTAAQAATVAGLGDLVHVGEITFQRGRVAEQVRDLLASSGHAAATCIAAVAPTWATLELLRAGFSVIEFANAPSARSRGVFVCSGAFLHRYAPGAPEPLGSEFFPCPVPVHEQEESPLTPGR